MTLPLTPDTLRQAYDLLNTTPPFSRWNLPDADDITFKVVRDKTVAGWHTRVGGKHTIAISASCVGHTARLVETMAHEMIHVHEENARACREDVAHSAAFMKWAALVCKIHGFDPKGF